MKCEHSAKLKPRWHREDRMFILIDFGYLHLSLLVQRRQRSEGREIRVTWLCTPPAKPPITYATVVFVLSGSRVMAWA